MEMNDNEGMGAASWVVIFILIILVIGGALLICAVAA